MWNPDTYNSWNTPNTNIEYVTSLEEALSRCNMRNIEKVFFHQDKNIFYRIRVDFDGKKYWQALEYNSPSAVEDTSPVTRADLTEIVSRLTKLEKHVYQPEVSNEQSDGQV